jgi:hypothetical protein
VEFVRVAFCASSDRWSAQERSDQNYADERNFYKVKKWIKDGMRLERMIYAGNSLDEATEVQSVGHRASSTGAADKLDSAIASSTVAERLK